MGKFLGQPGRQANFDQEFTREEKTDIINDCITPEQLLNQYDETKDDYQYMYTNDSYLYQIKDSNTIQKLGNDRLEQHFIKLFGSEINSYPDRSIHYNDELLLNDILFNYSLKDKDYNRYNLLSTNENNLTILNIPLYINPNQVFNFNRNLYSSLFIKKIVEIGKEAFKDCKFHIIKFDNNSAIEKIHATAFDGCNAENPNLISIVFPSTLTTYEGFTFNINSTHLTDITGQYHISKKIIDNDEQYVLHFNNEEHILTLASNFYDLEIDINTGELLYKNNDEIISLENKCITITKNIYTNTYTLEVYSSDNVPKNSIVLTELVYYLDNGKIKIDIQGE